MQLCYLLKYFSTSMGEVVLIDSPPGLILRLGMVLQKPGSELQWQIAGMGLPVILDMLSEKIERNYDSTRIFNCLLKPVNHTGSVKDENVLEIRDKIK